MWSLLRRNEKQFLGFLAIPLLVVIAAALIAYAVAGKTAAFVVSNAGTALLMLICLGYIVLFDSRRRWPQASAFQRLANVITFKRD